MKDKPQVYIVGICGGTASGKSHAVARIVESLLPMRVSVIDQDSYYKDLSHLPPDERARLNFDHPDAVDLDELAASLRQFKKGNAIAKPVYDFVTHTRLPHRKMVPATNVAIIEGLHILHIKEIREQIDHRVFIDIDNDIRFIRRLSRDIMERGRTLEGIISQYLDTVRPMHRAYVEPSKRFADLVISMEDFEEQLEKLIHFLRRHRI